MQSRWESEVAWKGGIWRGEEPEFCLLVFSWNYPPLNSSYNKRGVVSKSGLKKESEAPFSLTHFTSPAHYGQKYGKKCHKRTNFLPKVNTWSCIILNQGESCLTEWLSRMAGRYLPQHMPPGNFNQGLNHWAFIHWALFWTVFYISRTVWESANDKTLFSQRSLCNTCHYASEANLGGSFHLKNAKP